MAAGICRPESSPDFDCVQEFLVGLKTRRPARVVPGRENAQAVADRNGQSGSFPSHQSTGARLRLIAR